MTGDQRDQLVEMINALCTFAQQCGLIYDRRISTQSGPLIVAKIEIKSPPEDYE